MNNDKWLCTATVFQKEDGRFTVYLDGEPGASMEEKTYAFIFAAKAFEKEWDLSVQLGDYPAPADPKTT